MSHCHYSVTPEQLLIDLYAAYRDARRHKRWRDNQFAFELQLEENLVDLRDELMSRTYQLRPSTCFIIHEPKMREIFAADFRDRIVHHLFYNYTHELFERTFIADSYSCIKGRGTHFGIKRLVHHIRSESDNYQRECYVMQIDIKGYFMHIHRQRLVEISRATLESMALRPSNVVGKRWIETVDYALVNYLLDVIALNNPIEGCKIVGNRKEWNQLPHDKSLFCSAKYCGLPIGNLTSQLFSNVYMNTFDQYVKRTLGCRHYGRYVDDAFIVSCDRNYLCSLVEPIRKFLSTYLCLELNPEKLKISRASYGVLFLGAYLKPFRSYVSSATLRRMKRKLDNLDKTDNTLLGASINSYLGVFSHHRSYCLRKKLFVYEKDLSACGRFDPLILHFKPYTR